jgi:hypothetical protein
LYVLVGKPEGKRPPGRLDVDARIILDRILGKLSEKDWNVCIWLRMRTSGGLL